MCIILAINGRDMAKIVISYFIISASHWLCTTQIFHAYFLQTFVLLRIMNNGPFLKVPSFHKCIYSSSL